MSQSTANIHCLSLRRSQRLPDIEGAVDVLVAVARTTDEDQWSTMGSVTMVHTLGTKDRYIPAVPPNHWVSKVLLEALMQAFNGGLDRILESIANMASAFCSEMGEPSPDTEPVPVPAFTDPAPEPTFSDAPETPRSLRTPPVPTVPNPRTHVLRASWRNGGMEVHATYLGATVFLGDLSNQLTRTILLKDGERGSITVEVSGYEVPELELLEISKLMEESRKSGCTAFIDLFGRSIHGDQAAFQDLTDIPRLTTTDLEIVRVVCTSMIDQLQEAIKHWPDAEARTRISRLAPTLLSGLKQLGDDG